MSAFNRTGARSGQAEALRLEPYYEPKVGEPSADTLHDIGFL